MTEKKNYQRAYSRVSGVNELDVDIIVWKFLFVGLWSQFVLDTYVLRANSQRHVALKYISFDKVSWQNCLSQKYSTIKFKFNLQWKLLNLTFKNILKNLRYTQLFPQKISGKNWKLIQYTYAAHPKGSLAIVSANFFFGRHNEIK